MSKISLSTGFDLIPEGEYVFKIVSVTYKEAFGKLTVRMQTKEGYNHMESYNFSGSDKAIAAFSFLARAVMNDMRLNDIDPQDMVGRYFRGSITHDIVESTTNPGETKTFAHLGRDKQPADGFDIEDLPDSPAPAPASKGLDLHAILGR